MNRKCIMVLTGISASAAFMVNVSDWLYGGAPSTGKACVSAVFIVLVSLLLYAWRKSSTAMCLLTIASALLVIGAANGLLMALNVMDNMIFVPFTVLLMPLFGVMNPMPAAAAYAAALVVAVLWLGFAVAFWLHNRKSAGEIV